MAVARLVSLFESKSLDSASRSATPLHHDSFAARSLRSSPIMSSQAGLLALSIQPYHFLHKQASHLGYYDQDSSIDSSPSSSPSSSYRSNSRHSFRSASPMFSEHYTPTKRRFSHHLRLRRIPSHVDLALAAERDEQGLQLLEPRPVAGGAIDACLGRSGSPLVALDGIFEVLESN